MDQVDRDDRVDGLQRPVRRRYVQRQRRQEGPTAAGEGPVAGNAVQRLGIQVAGLPAPRRQPGREIVRMFAGAAGDLKDQTMRRKHAFEDVEDCVAVAQRRRRMPAPRAR